MPSCVLGGAQRLRAIEPAVGLALESALGMPVAHAEGFCRLHL